MRHGLNGGKENSKNTEISDIGNLRLRQNSQERDLPHIKLWTEIQTLVRRAQAWLSRYCRC